MNLKENSKIYFNEENNWICIGNSNIKDYDYALKFMENAIICLKNSEFEALWINPVYK